MRFRELRSRSVAGGLSAEIKGGDVLDYRLFYLDETGHICDALEFKSPSDDAAVLEVERSCDERAMELWQSARMVRRFARRDAPVDSSSGTWAQSN